MLRGAGLGHLAPVSGSSRSHSRIEPAVEPREVVGVGQPDVDDGEAARREVRGERPERRALGRAGREEEQRVQGENARPNEPASGRRRSTQVAPRRASAGRGRAPARVGAPSGAVEHRRVEVDAGHVVAGLGERDGEPAGPDGELEDRAAGPPGQGEIEVEVARVLDEVEVVQAGERRGGRRSCMACDAGVSRVGRAPARTGPSPRRAASPRAR